ncbi:flagellar hook-length control protein FliK [Vreelandella songnenensis]|uniref:Flagellar hook-length control protein FliK n=1 Tax=Vreelandella songnenensis TaxID=1176243 RepID=A0A2T0V361_9GAMM|nr:flagellar hook-length control protein FliK [Halomonas songnenensis]PRY64594.1 flagellar hook-length control protein FliK [Halomonas songnenensis]
MNIQLLLSGVQSQDASSGRPALTGALESSQTLFRQALSQAANAPSRLSQSAGSDAGEASATALLDTLQSLGFDLSEAELSSLLSQLSLAVEETAPSQPGLDTFNGEATTSLEEIAERLKLMASFSETSAPASPVPAPTLESIARQLDLDDAETANLLATLQALIDPRQPSATGAVNSLPLTKNEAAQVSSTLNALMAPLTMDNSKQIASLAESARQAPATQPSAAQWRGDDASWDTVYSRASYSASANVLNASTPLFTTQEVAAQLAALAAPSQPGSDALDDLMPSRIGQMAGSLQPPVSSSPTGTAPPAFISAPVTSPAWPSQLGQQLVQFSQRGGDQQVQMQLHPAELGPLSITLKITEQGTQAHFLSAHAQVRQVIEQAIPQLRETLAEQGISLGETSVGEQQNPRERSSSQQGKGAVADAGNSDSTPPGDNSAGTLTPDNNTLTLDGRVDLYA